MYVSAVSVAAETAAPYFYKGIFVHSRHIKMRTISGVAVLLISATSCVGTESATGNTATEGSSKAPSAPESSLNSGYAMRLPIASFSFTEEQNSVIRSAEAKVITRCLGRFGFDFIPSAPESTSVSEVDRRYGIADLNQAKKYGYHLPPRSPSPPPSPPSKEVAEILVGSQMPYPTGKKITTYRGIKVPEGGCRGEASREIRGAFHDASGASVAHDISVRGFKESMRTPAAIKAFHAWSSCMHEKGYRYKDPLAPLDNQRFFQDATASSIEIGTASADVQCKMSTRLLETWFTAESHIQNELISRHKSQLDRLHTYHMNEIDNAKRILRSA
jgi:hypothetical protein